MFAAAFDDVPAVIVADERTFEAAGRDVRDSFRQAGRTCVVPFLFRPDVDAEDARSSRLQAALAPTQAVPVAVGSGTLNDLTKLAAHRLGRPYLVVATAASMDGYTAFGASIMHEGSKQTVRLSGAGGGRGRPRRDRPRPRQINAAGYADLLAKKVAGADWIFADVAAVEAIDRALGNRPRLLALLGRVTGRNREVSPTSLRRLIVGLMTTGLAMQAAQFQPPGLGSGAPVQPSLGHAGPRPRWGSPLPRLQGRNRDAGLAGPIIGITRDRLRLSYEQAYYIRRRFTVLDFAMRVGVFGSALGELFGQGGCWAQEGADRDQKSRSSLAPVASQSPVDSVPTAPSALRLRVTLDDNPLDRCRCTSRRWFPRPIGRVWPACSGWLGLESELSKCASTSNHDPFGSGSAL